MHYILIKHDSDIFDVEPLIRCRVSHGMNNDYD